MVREVKVSYDLVVSAEVVAQRLVVGYSGEQDKSLGVKIARISFWKYCLRMVIAYSCREDVLVISYSEGFRPFALFPCIKIGRAF